MRTHLKTLTSIIFFLITNLLDIQKFFHKSLKKYGERTTNIILVVPLPFSLNFLQILQPCPRFITEGQGGKHPILYYAILVEEILKRTFHYLHYFLVFDLVNKTEISTFYSKCNTNKLIFNRF